MLTAGIEPRASSAASEYFIHCTLDSKANKVTRQKIAAFGATDPIGNETETSTGGDKNKNIVCYEIKIEIVTTRHLLTTVADFLETSGSGQIN